MSEGSEPKEGFSRREFLKRTAAIAAGLTAGALSGSVPEKGASATNEVIPKDTLSSAELEKMHITIYQTPLTKLFLRRDVKDIPLFKDTIEGKFDQVIIQLVENDMLSYDATRTLPKDAQAVWDAMNLAPDEYYQRMLPSWQATIIDSHTTQAIRDEAQKELSRNPKDVKAEYAQEGPRGLFIPANDIPKFDWVHQDQASFLERHPECRNKVYIFVAVGGDAAPKPEESFINPQMILPFTSTKSPRYSYRFDIPTQDGLSGYVLRHELGHYEDLQKENNNPDSTYDVGSGDYKNVEYRVDTLAFNRIEEAWRAYKTTGDSRGYPFVFVNRNGITITETQQSKI